MQDLPVTPSNSQAATLAERLVGLWSALRWRAPRIAILCMDFHHHRRARVELRITAPASAGDWTIRRIESLSPFVAGLSRRSRDEAATALHAALCPHQPDGRWFVGDASLWLTYAADQVPAHRVRLRLTLDQIGGQRRMIIASAALPAMNWTATEVPPRDHRLSAPAGEQPAPRRLAPVPVEVARGRPTAGLEASL
jgi:hypothetical protein